VPIELKILGVLRRLGRGGCFDDAWDGSGIDQETNRIFFHKFCKLFSEEFFSMYVKPPTTPEEIERVTRIYKLLGFPGAVGSVDCVHIKWDKCPFGLRSSCKGKEGFPTLSYEVSVDHTKRILSATRSHYGARNDKTIVKYDEHIMNIHNGDLYSDCSYVLYNADGSVAFIRGLYMICDGGYHKWRSMQCPLKHTSDSNAAKWSCNLESVRKDVEDLFGILKMRFRILRNGVELHNQEQIDYCFFTVCILNNLLLTYDGYDKRWDDVDWKTHDPDANHDSTFDGQMRKVDRRARDRVVKSGDLIPFIADSCETEIEDDHFTLREKLIVHYKIARQKGEVMWLN